MAGASRTLSTRMSATSWFLRNRVVGPASIWQWQAHAAVQLWAIEADRRDPIVGAASSNWLGVQFMTGSSVGKRFGVIDDDRQRAMSGLEFVQGLVDGTLPLNTMAETLGYDIVEVSKGRVVAAAEPHAGHRNPAGTVHGGFAATLLDSCMGLAVQSMLDKGYAQTTLEFKISLVRPITPQTGLVKAEGKVITCGRRVGTAEGRLTDKDGRVLAHGTTTCLIFEH